MLSAAGVLLPVLCRQEISHPTRHFLRTSVAVGNQKSNKSREPTVSFSLKIMTRHSLQWKEFTAHRGETKRRFLKQN